MPSLAPPGLSKSLDIVRRRRLGVPPLGGVPPGQLAPFLADVKEGACSGDSATRTALNSPDGGRLALLEVSPLSLSPLSLQMGASTSLAFWGEGDGDPLVSELDAA